VQLKEIKLNVIDLLQVMELSSMSIFYFMTLNNTVKLFLDNYYYNKKKKCNNVYVKQA